jgi:hypothetical protein
MSVAAVLRRPGPSSPLAAATLLAAACGAALGIVLAPGGTPPPRADPQPRIGLASGVAKLPLPPDWRPLRRLSTLPGFEEATAVRGLRSELALDIRRPEDASLLPAGVEDAVPGGLPAPAPRRVGARTAWRYELPGDRPGTRLVALTLPTTGGVVTFACQSQYGATGPAEAECAQAVRLVRLDGAAALPPAPETAARIVLPGAIAKLNARRHTERRRLAASTSPAVRAAAALRLAAAYAAAAERLRPLAAGDAVRLTATLGALARAHRALASASRHRDAPAAFAAGATIERQETRLSEALVEVTRPHAAR